MLLNPGKMQITATMLMIMALLPASEVYGEETQTPASPVIAAPGEPGRAAPTLTRDAPTSTRSGYNNFFASDSTSPPLEGFLSPTSPVVIELFTSQGCSSCPAADALLERLTDEPGVLPLSLHVDYWDYLGWKDSFAQPEFTARQEAYARSVGEHSVYTPQLIINGIDTAVAPSPAQVLALIDAHRTAPALVTVSRETTKEDTIIEIIPLSDLGGMVNVILVRYAPEREVKIKSGENRGREIRYINVVLSLERLADWDGAAPLRMNVRLDDEPSMSLPPDARSVVLVQRKHGEDELPGKILAAVRLD